MAGSGVPAQQRRRDHDLKPQLNLWLWKATEAYGRLRKAKKIFLQGFRGPNRATIAHLRWHLTGQQTFHTFTLSGRIAVRTPDLRCNQGRSKQDYVSNN